MLKSGAQVKSEIMKINLNVIKKLGEGTQGAVYLVEKAGTRYALKWYNPDFSTHDQKDAIQKLVLSGPPKGQAGKRFIWPLDLVTLEGDDCFGYLMPLIDMSIFTDLGKAQAGVRQFPSFTPLCEISYQTANSYRTLHLAGYCYRDISDGNIVFDPVKGDVLICDNDNVGIDKESKAQVKGTMEFMAPQVIRGESDPSALTDLHSLAVLLFKLWIWHHPFHGQLEYDIYSLDIPAKKQLYGKNPVFIFDPKNTTNRLPNDPEYDTARKMWKLCPISLKNLFMQAFTEGLDDPTKRVTEGQWQKVFLQLKDGIIACPKCHAENIWEYDLKNIVCWNSKTVINIPPKAVFNHKYGINYLILNADTQILKRHIHPVYEDDGALPIGKVVQNPNNPNIWGIKNLTNNPWQAVKQDGTVLDIPPQRSVPLLSGIKVTIEGINVDIIQ